MNRAAWCLLLVCGGCGLHGGPSPRQMPAADEQQMQQALQMMQSQMEGAQDLAAEEEPGQGQEHVDAAGNPAEPDVEHRDERDRDPAQAVEVVAIKARRGRPRSDRVRGGDRRRRRWQGRHGRPLIYRNRHPLLSGRKRVAAGRAAEGLSHGTDLRLPGRLLHRHLLRWRGDLLQRGLLQGGLLQRGLLRGDLTGQLLRRLLLKRRLLGGPEEFQSVRVDRPAKKR